MQYNERIGKLTNQENIKQEILYCMHQQNFSAFKVIGKRGTGKRTLSKIIAESWKIQNKGIVFYLEPAFAENKEDYSSFKSLILENDTKKITLNIFEEALKDIPVVGNTISAIATEVINFLQSFKRLSDEHGHTEQCIISILTKYMQKHAVLFVCNNFDIWDLKSQQMLSVLIRYVEHKCFENKVFFIINTECKSEKSSKGKIQCHYLSHINKDNLKEVVNCFNSEIHLKAKQLEQLMELTKGNLQLIKESLSLYNKESNLVEHSFYNIIEREIKKETKNFDNIIHLLKHTAFIGEKTNSRLLKLFSEQDIIPFEDALDESIRMRLLCEEGTTISFLQQYIYSIIEEHIYKDRKYYMRLSKCIDMLYPSRYDLQMQYLQRGNLIYEADKKYLIFLLSYYRENNVEYRLDEIDQKRLSNNHLFTSFQCLCQGYRLYKAKKYNEAENLLINLYCDCPEFRFEKDYLLSLITTNKYCTIENFLERIDILQTYVTEEFKQNFPEMYIRGLMILTELYAESGKSKETKESLQEVFRFFSTYSLSDKQIQCYEYCFKMKANAFYKVEIATNYTRSAYEYFSQLNNIQYYSKYYLSALNHSANKIVLGDFSDAYNILLKVYGNISNYHYIESIHPDIWLNNLSISGYFAKQFSAIDCANMLENLIVNYDEQADILLLKNNQAVFYALGNELKKALLISSTLYQEIEFNDDIDEYYRYYILNNYGMLLWLLHGKEAAKNIINELFTLMPLPQERAYFKARSEVIRDMLETITPSQLLQKEEWNSYLRKTKPHAVGAAWEFWGNLLLFSELQIWSDY